MKVEDKPKIYQMAVDNLAFAIYLARNKQQFIQLIQKGIGAKAGSDRENNIVDTIMYRYEIQAFPLIAMPSGRIQFQQWVTRAEERVEIESDTFTEPLPHSTILTSPKHF